MNALLGEFASRDAKVFGVSADSVHTNRAYAESMGGLDYPLLSDWNPHGKWTQEFGIFLPDSGCPSRSTVIIDKHGIVRDVHTNPIGEDRDFTLTLQRLDQINQS